MTRDPVNKDKAHYSNITCEGSSLASGYRQIEMMNEQTYFENLKQARRQDRKFFKFFNDILDVKGNW